MTGRLWKRVEELLPAALERSTGDRLAYLDEVCGSDAELRGVLEKLLAADLRHSDFLEVPLLGLSEDTEGDLEGTMLGAYLVGRQIGAGGMGVVYLATRADAEFERTVAIKVLHPELAAALGSERFLSEIKTTAKLQHPHILPLLDSGEVLVLGGDNATSSFASAELYSSPPLGAPCTGSAQCLSGFCVDGVCCTSSCTGTCMACNVAGSLGTCAPVPDRTDPAAECGMLSCLGYYTGWAGDRCHWRCQCCRCLWRCWWLCRWRCRLCRLPTRRAAVRPRQRGRG